MAQIDEKQIEEIVSQVLKTLQQGGSTAVQPHFIYRCEFFRAGVFATAAEAIAAAKIAQAAFVKLGVC